tara:strand:+ start:272 stop:607 length:336 start_codon:yes stop_codon:yes gene_type:complete
MNISNKLQQIAEDNQFDIDLQNLYYNEDTFSDFCDKVHNSIMEEDIIYYHVAMKYLSREDSSLAQSLEIAHELGYNTENLNSELLATLLYQQNLTNQWYEISEKIEEIFNN